MVRKWKKLIFEFLDTWEIWKNFLDSNTTSLLNFVVRQSVVQSRG